MDDVYILFARFVIDARYSFMRFTTGYVPMQEGWDLASLGFSSTFINNLKQLDPRALKLPNLSFVNYFTQDPIGGAEDTDNQQIYMVHELAVNVTNVLRGTHTAVRDGLSRDIWSTGFDMGMEFVGDCSPLTQTSHRGADQYLRGCAYRVLGEVVYEAQVGKLQRPWIQLLEIVNEG